MATTTVDAPPAPAQPFAPRALPWRRTLAAKYAVWLSLLVAGALLASSALQTEFSFRERQGELVVLQREKANVVAGRIERFLTEIALNMDWVVLPGLNFQTGQAAQVPPGQSRPPGGASGKRSHTRAACYVPRPPPRRGSCHLASLLH